MKTKLLGILACTMFVAVIGCAPARTDDGRSTGAAKVTLKNTHAFHAPATKDTTAALGITTWHLMLEGNSHSIIIDGSDAKGAIKFSSAIRQDPKDKVLHIQSFAQKGEFSLAKQGENQFLVTSSLDIPLWSKYSKAFTRDFSKKTATVEYGLLGDFLDKAATVTGFVSQVTGGLGVIASVIPHPTGQAASKILMGVSAATDKASRVLDIASKTVGEMDDEKDEGNAAAREAAASFEMPDPEKADPKMEIPDPENPDPKMEIPDPENPDPDSIDNQEEDGTGAAENEEGEGELLGDATPEADGEGDQGDELPGDNVDDSLDENGLDQGGDDDAPAEEGGGEEAGGDEGGGEEAGGDEGGGEEAGGDEGGGEEAGGDEGGGEEFALHKARNTCRAVTCSKKTKICICKKY